MKTYVVTGRPLHIKSGTLRLTKEQAATRDYCIKPVHGTKDEYMVTGEACFKIGEKIGYDGPDIKALLNMSLMEIDQVTGEMIDKKISVAKIRANKRNKKTAGKSNANNKKG